MWAGNTRASIDIIHFPSVSLVLMSYSVVIRMIWLDQSFGSDHIESIVLCLSVMASNRILDNVPSYATVVTASHPRQGYIYPNEWYSASLPLIVRARHLQRSLPRSSKVRTTTLISVQDLGSDVVGRAF
jgi:hypothetical protein